MKIPLAILPNFLPIPDLNIYRGLIRERKMYPAKNYTSRYAFSPRVKEIYPQSFSGKSAS